ncbi:hypothetical protein INT48_003140 [Thamnidium elegans]|uniref:C2H2-type domain-containing protein n=1 Tax=Thamnidium elegans TaxID=101142 RepID=A0A8H7SDQ1_9FUNG|nr:hypothetical protein INT48_003140 [Thamnidium elegans]
MDKIHEIKTLVPLKPLSSVDGPDVNNPNNYCTSCNRRHTKTKGYRKHLFDAHNLLISSKASRRVESPNMKPVVDCLKRYCDICNSYGGHMSVYHHIKIRPTKLLLHRINRNDVPIIDEIGNHCTACDKIRDIIPDYENNHFASCNRTYSGKSNYRRHLATIHKRNKLETKQEDTNEKFRIQ